MSSREIAQGNYDLSARTEEQAGSLEQTASSMEELTSAVQQNGASAQRAGVLADQAAGVARRGGTAAAQMIETMGSINASSRKIVDTIGVIDGIAFQTNILALKRRRRGRADRRTGPPLRRRRVGGAQPGQPSGLQEAVSVFNISPAAAPAPMEAT